jgi:hypothetical protein
VRTRKWALESFPLETEKRLRESFERFQGLIHQTQSFLFPTNFWFMSVETLKSKLYTSEL